MILLVSTWLVGYFQGGSYSRTQTQNSEEAEEHVRFDAVFQVVVHGS
jgi:hypothetical protein